MKDHEQMNLDEANIVISLGDLLSVSKCGCAAMSSVVCMLQDKNISVRKNSLMVISHLILNGMLKQVATWQKLLSA